MFSRKARVPLEEESNKMNEGKEDLLKKAMKEEEGKTGRIRRRVIKPLSENT